MNINYDDIENKYKDIIDIAKNYMTNIKDHEHDLNHMNDVVSYTKKLLNKINLEVNYEVCIISAYFHDVGRIKQNEGHEVISAEILKDIMKSMKYDDNLINECYKAIENHKWNMHPNTIEGLIIKDADKLAWLGTGRWESCISNKQNLDEIIELLPRLKKEFLYFEESKEIYDEEIIKLLEYLYKLVK
jgi:HD superfamily phosphodiesterase